MGISTRLAEESVKTAPQFLRIVVPLLVFTSFGFCSASSFYITRDGAGSKNGSSLANAAACDATPGVAQGSCAAFNNSANWGSGSNQIGPGTVIHLGGDGVAITAAAGSACYLNFQASGASGNVIELLFDAGFSPSGLNAPAWGSGAICTGNNQYILIDGGANTPCGANTANSNGPTQPNPCNGTIQATANGDGLSYHQDYSYAIYASAGCNNLEVRDLGIYNMYVKSDISASGPSNSQNIFCDGNSTTFSFHDNQMHDMETGLIMVPFSGTQGPWSWYNNDLYNMNWGLILGAGGSSTVSSHTVYGNHLHDMANWTTSSNQYHHDGMYWYGNSNTTTFTALYVYNNVFDGNTTNGACSGCDMTSWWYSDNSAQYRAAYIFNNVWMATSNTPSNAGPFLMGFAPSSTTAYIFNNTYACNASAGSYQHMGAAGIAPGSGGAGTITLLNNLFSTCGNWITMPSTGSTFASSGLDGNVYSNPGSGNEWIYHGNYWSTLSQWQSGTGQDGDAKSTTGSAGLGGSYENNSRSPLPGIVPQSGSIAVGAGANLYTSLCSTLNGISAALGTACQQDITGAARPTSTAWDAGALQSGPGSTVAPPTALTATVD